MIGTLDPLTVDVLIVTVTALIIFDIVQLTRKGVSATISHVVLAAATRWPIIPFAIGVVAGHFFWPNS